MAGEKTAFKTERKKEKEKYKLSFYDIKCNSVGVFISIVQTR